eukprot:c45626_g1_i1.p1 GENE.c45626_g1_i1~~c45626_g1_i1.p1  ORF type:complete len:312 (+),score=64.39 c45626_g1_i1:28-936(+)
MFPFDLLASYESGFLCLPAITWTQNHTELPIFAVALYIVFIFQVPQFLEKPINLRIINAIWDLSLSIFSVFGVLGLAPVLWRKVSTDGLFATVCDDPCAWYGDGRSGLWMLLFVYSKFPELIDTVFLVLQKKKVIFLHWFHHVTVLLYCWHAYHTKIGPGIWFAVMNYCVHSIMYFYYFLGLIGFRRVFKPIAPLITFLQLAQMVGGIVITVLSVWLHAHDPTCHVDPANMKLGLAMYFSYFVLFALLFHNLYILPKDQSKKPINPGCPDIATRYNVTDASGFFHGDNKDQAKTKPEQKKQN